MKRLDGPDGAKTFAGVLTDPTVQFFDLFLIESRVGFCKGHQFRILPKRESVIGKKSKVNHLTYIGDSKVGKSVNIGAGTITCNYDGKKKYVTNIKDKVFIGSNSSLVAPITIGEGSTIGAGSVITRNVKRKSLALTRSEQKEVKNYKTKKK